MSFPKPVLEWEGYCEFLHSSFDPNPATLEMSLKAPRSVAISLPQADVPLCSGQGERTGPREAVLCGHGCSACGFQTL